MTDCSKYLQQDTDKTKRGVLLNNLFFECAGRRGQSGRSRCQRSAHADRTLATSYTDMPTSKHKAEPAEKKSGKETNKKR